MALTKVSSSLVSDSAVTSGKIADGGVATADIATNAVTSTKIAQNSILTKHIDDGQVTTDQLGADAVTAAKIADDAISEEHLDVTVITSLTAVTAATGDLLMIADVSDSNNLKKIPVSSILAGTHTGAVNTSGTINSGAITASADISVVESNDAKLIVNSVGDYFPSLEIKRTSASSKTNYAWNFQIGSSGFLNLIDGTNSYYSAIFKNNGDIALSNDTDSTNPVLLLDKSASSATFAGTINSGAITSSSAAGSVGFNYGTSSSPERGNLWYSTDGTGWKFNIGKVQSNSFASQITIQDNGNVGIGTSSPYTLLELSSTDPIIRMTDSNGVADKSIYEMRAIGASGYESLEFRSVNDANSVYNKLLVLKHGGNVGIGTDDPQHKLDVEGGNNVFDIARFGSSASDNSEVTIGYFDANANNGIPALIAASDFGGLIQGGENGHLVLGIRDNDATDALDIVSGGGNFMTDTTYDTLVATFKASGNVGIGTGSPSSALTVQGALSIRNSTQSFNGGLSSEVNSGVINFGVNEGSGNRFGGSYTQANQGGFMHFDTRSGQPLFEIYGRAAGTANASGTALVAIESDGATTFTGTINGFGLKTFGTASLLISDDGNTGSLSSADYNTGFGHDVFNSFTTGDYNTSVGFGSMGSAAVTGEGNTGMGMYALRYITSGSGNVGIGWDSAINLNSGSLNVAVGKLSLKTNQTGGQNVAIGTSALQNYTESYNTAVGYRAMISCTSGERNTAIGYDTMVDLQTGESNTAVGHNALKVFTGSDNTAVGRNALDANISGANCTAIGESALSTNTASHQTAVGKGAGQSVSTGAENVLVGHEAGRDGNFSACTIVGRRAGAINTGINNTFVGHESGTVMTSGTRNLILGRHSGNQHGLDIRATNNNIVLADGDGHVGFHNVVNTGSVFGHVDVTRNASSGNSILVGGNATVNLFGGNNAFSGIFLINDFTRTGKVCLVMTGGGEISIIHQTAGDFVLSSSPGSGEYGIYLSSLGIKLKNGTSTAFSCRILGLRTRNQQ